jgi:hypothetical protein
MDHVAAQEWLDLMVEVSVGVYVFLISVPALIYNTFIPQELRELRDKSAFRQIRPFSGKFFWYVVLIFLFAAVHFFVEELWPDTVQECDNWYCLQENLPHPPGSCCFFSPVLTILSSCIFAMLLISVRKSFSEIKKGYVKLIAENLKKSLQEHFKKSDTVEKRFDSPLLRWFYSPLRQWKSRTAIMNNESELWREVEVLGKYTSPGSQKQTWLASMEGIILPLLNSPRNNVESLRTAIKILGDVMGDASNTANYENVKLTLDIYRALLNKLHDNAKMIAEKAPQPERAKARDEYMSKFTECYSAIFNSLHSFAFTAVREDKTALLYSIISTMTLVPNHSSKLFEIAVMTLRHEKYEILAHSFNEIIGKGGNDGKHHYNFWGIYAALYLKDGAFREHAENMRKAAGYPIKNIRDLREAYHYHFGNADFDVANNLYKLIKRQAKKESMGGDA